MIALHDISLRGVDLSGVGLHGVRLGDMDVKGGGSTPEPEPDITDAILLENGLPMLLENGSYFRIESVATDRMKIDKSYWNF